MSHILYKKPHFYKKRFYNHHADQPQAFFLKTSVMIAQSLWQSKIKTQQEAPLWSHSAASQPETCSIAWIGHATFMIELDGLVILTDPVFGSLSPFFTRTHAPGIAIDTLKQVDVILLSHNHRDHMDTASLRSLKHFSPRILVPWGVKKWFDKRGFSHVSEYEWWQHEQYVLPNGNPLKFSFLPAHHWSQRGLFDKNKTLWGSWMIEYKGLTVYFAGDTAYAPHFKIISDNWNDIDVALMPIAPCEPRQWLKQSHLDAHEAVTAFCDLKAQHFIPMHWGTFRFGVDSFSAPIERLYTAWQHHFPGVSDKQLSVPQPGHKVALNAYLKK